MNTAQYHVTPKGRKALTEGSYLVHMANEAAKDGSVTTKSIMELWPGLEEPEAEYVIKALLRMGMIVENSIQGVPYEGKKKGRWN